MIKNQNGNLIAENVNVIEWIKAHPQETVIYHFAAINEMIIYK